MLVHRTQVGRPLRGKEYLAVQGRLSKVIGQEPALQELYGEGGIL